MSSINSLTDFTESIGPINAANTSSETPAPSIKIQRKLTSNVWQYCTPPPEHGPLLNATGKPIWKCQACIEKKKKTTELLLTGGTHAIRRHLKHEHGILIQTVGEEKKAEHGNAIQDIRTYTTNDAHPFKRRKPTTHAHELDEAVLREIYCRYIVEENLSITHCQSIPFRILLFYINTAANDLLPSSPTTIKADLERSYSAKKLLVKQALQSAISSIHLTPDGWTSPNHLGLLGVVAHFVSEDKGVQHLTIALKELDGPHNGENMAGVLYEMLQDYGITNKIGYIMSDNAKPNDTMMSRLSEYLQQNGIDYSPKLRRLRCNGHIINLTVMAFFFGKHPLAKVEGYNGPDLTEMQQWRTYGPFGRLHNIVVYIQGSPQRRAEFRKLTDGLNLRRDQKTRWNSWYMMITWACEPRIKGAIKRYCAEEPDLQEDLLLIQDWKTLADIGRFLAPFYDATKATEGQKHSVERVLPTMDYLLDHYEKSTERYEDNDFMKPCIETGWAKLEEYYKKTDETPIYAAAVVLDPSWKWTYFEQHWADKHPEWIPIAKRHVLKLWKDHYQSTSTAPDIRMERPLQEPVENQFLGWYNRRASTTRTTTLDEYATYCGEALIDPFALKTPIDWWLDPVQRRRFPHLSLMALDLLSIPAMSADTERLFSEAKLTITDQRGAMDATTLELLQCLRSWNRSTLLSTAEDTRYNSILTSSIPTPLQQT